jgi:hypothetical protein
LIHSVTADEPGRTGDEDVWHARVISQKLLAKTASGAKVEQGFSKSKFFL